MKQMSYRIKGMHCPSCVESIEKALYQQEGVSDVAVNFATETLKISFDEQKVSEKTLEKVVRNLGYELYDMEKKEHKHNHMAMQEDWYLAYLRIQVIISLVIAALLQVPMFVSVPVLENKWVQLLCASVVQFWIGWPFYKQFWQDIKNRALGMYTLIALGTSVAYFYSAALALFPTFFISIGVPLNYYFESGVTIIGFILLGRYLELRARKNMSAAIAALIKLRPDIAVRQIKKGDAVRWEEIPIEHVQVNDILLVKTGERVPADGIVVEGESSVDESMMTGESEPVVKKKNATVIGGTINLVGSFTMRATHVGESTMLAKIIRLVEGAQGSQIPVQRIVHKISAIFVPIVIVTALVTFIVWFLIGPDPKIVFATISLVSVLIIACPCALGLATPTSIMVGINRAATEGILIRNAEVLETMKKVNVIVFDKTGTLTEAHRSVQEIYFSREMESIVALKNNTFDSPLQYVCSLIYSVEKASSHPVARAIVNKVTEKGLKDLSVTNFEAFVGRGIKAHVNGFELVMGSLDFIEKEKVRIPSDIQEKIKQFADQKLALSLVALNGLCIGVFGVQDTIQKNARFLIQFLKEHRIKTVMITGDNEKNAHYVGDQVGIDEIHAHVLPEDKQLIVKKLQEEGNIVAMVGDGINDAPALATAQIGIAMGEGTDVAIESSDVVLLRDNLVLIQRLYVLSEATIRNIYQNLFWAFGYNILLIPVATGILYPFFHITINPMLAGAAMAFSSISVVLNALRLKWVKL